MTIQDNDTLQVEQQNVTNQPKADKSRTKDAMIAKLLASAVVGMATGAGAAYAAGKMTGAEEIVEPATDEAQSQQDAAEQQNQAPQAAPAQPAQPTAEERLAKLEEQERIRQQQEQERQRREMERQRREEERQHQEEERQRQEAERQRQEGEDKDKEEGEFFKEHKVTVGSVEERTLEDGSTVHVYNGTVDEHEAVFLGDEENRIVAAIIDENDNGSIDENEVVDLRPYNMTDQQLAVHQVSEPTHEVQVLAVEHDVDIDGQTVDVASIAVDNEQILFVDMNQNGEVDLAIADRNHNNNIEEDEINVVSESHITMPTEDDITGNMVADVDGGNDTTEDYSNDADTTVYEV